MEFWLLGVVWEKLEDILQLDKNETSKWVKEYYSGKISFKEWERRVENAYKQAGLTKLQLQKVLEKIEFNPDALDFLKWLNKRHPEIKKRNCFK